MRTALASKIALCVCPPALVAASVATVPPVRRTVHRLTAPHHPHVVHHRPRHRVAVAPCAPAPAGGGPGVLRTFASPGPLDDGTAPGSGPLSTGSPTLLTDLPPAAGDYRGPYAGGTPTVGGLIGPQVVSTPGTGVITPTPTPTTTVPGTGTDTPPAVPEPLTWLLMLAGVGGAGAALRRRGGHRAARGAGGALSRAGRAGAVAEALATPLDSLGATANGMTGAAATGAKSTKAALLAKAALCVCPPALLATGVATVPPVRHAVHAVTAPYPGLRPALATVPCDPAVAIDDPYARERTVVPVPGAAVPVTAEPGDVPDVGTDATAALGTPAPATGKALPSAAPRAAAADRPAPAPAAATPPAADGTVAA